MSVDVVIVGAGPAGFSAASAFATHGISTLVCDSGSIPSGDDCGDTILPNGVAALERLGVAREELRAVGQPVAGVRYISAKGTLAEADFAEGAGVAIRRVELSKIFAQHLRKFECVTLLENSRAAVECDAMGVRVSVNDQLFKPRLVIAADGLNSATRNVAGLHAEYRSPERWSAEQLFRTSQAGNHIEIYWGSDSQVTLTPMAPDQVRVSLLAEQRYGTEGARVLSQRVLEAFPRLRALLANAEPLSEPHVVGPLHQSLSRVARDGLVLMGDAAGSVDALAGEGVAMAACQGTLLEDVVRAVFRARREDRMVTERELKSFARACQSSVEYAHEMTRWLVQLTHRPKLLERTIQVFAREPELFQHFLTASMGLASPFALSPRIGVRALAGFALPSLGAHPQLRTRLNA
jgi:2-polyprenyl-6-methoxyphenol hydroxylase-like FAD-dependent oxidoreductase